MIGGIFFLSKVTLDHLRSADVFLARFEAYLGRFETLYVPCNIKLSGYHTRNEKWANGAFLQLDC